MQRTDWAEQFAEDFYSKPLVREFVFRSARYLDGYLEKEVCDFVLVLRGKAILIQMKCQEDPTSRSGEKLERWVIKQANAALTQVQGSLRTISERNFWCDHPRRGHVDFANGQLKAIHGIVLVEQFEGRICLPPEFPMEYSSVPISYFTTNEFLNIVDQLRAFPEIVQYLDNRHQLPEESLRGVGGERVFFEKYILKDGSFEGWTTYPEVAHRLREHRAEIQASLKEKTLADRDASLIEYVADQLSKRGVDPKADLPAAFAAHVDPPDKRTGYLRMQEHLCDLPLSARRSLGAQFRKVCEKLDGTKKESDFVYAAAWADSKPGFVFVFACSRQIPRPQVLGRTWVLLKAAMAHYGKTAGMAISDRDGKSFEVALIEGFVPEQDDRALAEQFFARLKTFDVPMSLVPGKH
jgi:hypothetical protein